MDTLKDIKMAGPSITKLEKEIISEMMDTGWDDYKYVEKFETEFAKWHERKYCLMTPNCTQAIHLLLLALGIKGGDEVIVPAQTWISTAETVTLTGAKVVFCDIDLNTFNIDVSKIESLITEKTKVILPVHLFGLSADIDPILKIAQRYDLNIVEDAACGFGSFYNGKHVGTFGNTGCFSFHPRKAITTGEGGMITTNDEKLASKLRCLRDHGADVSDLQRHTSPKPYLLADHNEAGYNQRMTDIQAALGSKQMDRADEITKERKRLAQNYDNAFKNLDWLKTPKYKNNYVHGFQSYPCIYSNEIISLDNQFDNFDYWIPLQNLIYLLTPDLDSNCPSPTLLKIDDNKLIEWETLIEIDNNVKIGLNWQGSLANPRVSSNTVDLNHFKNIFKNSNANFISLQKGNALKSIEDNNFQNQLINYDLLIDTGSQKFKDTAAIIKLLDLVITTDTSIAHLAGTLGTQTWLLLPKVSDWRWMNSKDETIWYDNLRIYRQKVQGEWNDVFSRVEKDCDQLIKNISEIRNS